MGIVICRPAAVGYVDEWSLGAGASKAAAVDPLDPVSHDDDTTYIQGNSSDAFYEREAFTILTFDCVAVTSVTLKSRWKRTTGSCEMGHYLRLSGTNGAINYEFAAGAYADFASAAYARPGGGSWGPADFGVAGSLEMACRTNLSVPAGNTGRCTSLWCEVDCELPGGMYAYLIASLAGAAVTMAQMPGLTRAVARIKGVRIMPEEYGHAFDEFKTYRYPRRFCLGA